MEDKLKDCQIKFRLATSMKEDIEKLAKEKDVSASWIIREALKQYIKNQEETQS